MEHHAHAEDEAAEEASPEAEAARSKGKKLRENKGPRHLHCQRSAGMALELQ